jgi:hypothetical protein
MIGLVIQSNKQVVTSDCVRIDANDSANSPYFQADSLASTQVDPGGFVRISANANASARTPAATDNATCVLPGDPDLDTVINAWPKFSVEARAKIVAIIRGGGIDQ